jgi:hypothetical protein
MERRRFSLLDAMILIAATAVGLGLVRVTFSNLATWMPQVFTKWPPMMAMHYRVTGFGPLLASSSVAMIWLHLIPPRPSFRQLARSPGFAASLASGLGIVLCFATNGVEQLVLWVRGMPVVPLYLTVNGMPMTVVIAIASAWVSITAGRRWRRRRGLDWRERLALAVAWAWILLYAAQRITVVLRD